MQNKSSKKNNIDSNKKNPIEKTHEKSKRHQNIHHLL